MKIKIISDSTCDLSPELVKKYDISIVPLYVVMGDKIRKDGIEATPEDIYEYVSQSGKLPKTSAPNLNDFLSAFRNWRNQGYEIVHFNISSDFSSSHATARMAAEEVGGVEVVDTRNLSTGEVPRHDRQGDHQLCDRAPAEPRGHRQAPHFHHPHSLL